MPRETLDKQIKVIQDEVLLLGSMIEKAVLNSVTSLKKRDQVIACRILAEDEEINEKRYAIENAILILIATQQPLAHDLRLLAGMLDVISELERMGDYAKGIAKVTQRLGDVDIPVPMRDIEKMAEQALSMLHKALGFFINEDARQAANLPKQDDIVDALYTSVYHNVIQTMVADPSIIDSANLLLWVAHNLERLADRVTNICERTVFIATGEILEMDTEDCEETE